jgi:hypothetical protein
VPSGQSLTSAVASGTAPGTYKLTFTIYKSSSICSGTGTAYPSTGSFPLTVGACAAPDPDYLEYGVYRYTKAFSSQLAAVIMTSSLPASNAQGVTLNFYRKLTDCQAGGPVSNQVNMATGLCIPNPSQSTAANSGTIQLYTILQVLLYYNILLLSIINLIISSARPQLCKFHTFLIITAFCHTL